MTNQILSILDQLASTNSTIDKIKILETWSSSELLQRVLRLTYDSSINFFLKKIPSYSSMNSQFIDFSLTDGLDFLENELATRKVTGNSAIDKLFFILSGMSSDDALIISRVLERDLKVGINTKTIQKVFPTLISKMEVMLADSDISKIRYPAIAQPKLDGLRAHITRDQNSISIVSRNGKSIDDLGYLTDSAMALMEHGETWDGEIVCVDPMNPTSFLDRKTSNGIINKAIRGTISDKEAALIRFNTWDIVIKNAQYHERLNWMKERFDSVSHLPNLKFYPIYGQIVDNYDQVMKLYNKEILKGGEGLVIKNQNSLWQPKRSKDLCKIKEIRDCDLRVIGWEIGTGKNINRLGNLILATDDGQLEVAVGTGFTDEERDRYTSEFCIGKIAAVQYNAIIKDKNGGKYSLFLPRFVEFRDDKDTTDSILSLKV